MDFNCKTGHMTILQLELNYILNSQGDTIDHRCHNPSTFLLLFDHHRHKFHHTPHKHHCLPLRYHCKKDHYHD